MATAAPLVTESINTPAEATGEYREMLIRLMTRQIYAETATAEVFGRAITAPPAAATAAGSAVPRKKPEAAVVANRRVACGAPSERRQSESDGSTSGGARRTLCRAGAQ